MTSAQDRLDAQYRQVRALLDRLPDRIIAAVGSAVADPERLRRIIIEQLADVSIAPRHDGSPHSHNGGSS